MTIYACNSLEYTDYEDISGYEIRKETDSVILIEGFHREAGCRHYHWAANEPGELLAAVGKADNCLMEFIPKEWVDADPSSRNIAITLTFRHFVKVSPIASPNFRCPLIE